MSPELKVIPPNSEHPHLGPLECHLHAFISFLQSKGYSAKTLRRKLQITCHFSRWLGERAINVSDLDELTINLFIEEPLKKVNVLVKQFHQPISRH